MHLLAGKRVPPGTPGVVKRTLVSRKWYGVGIPNRGKKRVPLCADKKAARRMLDDLVRDAERGAVDLPSADAGRTTLAAYLDRFGADVRAGLASRSKKKKVPSEA